MKQLALGLIAAGGIVLLGSLAWQHQSGPATLGLDERRAKSSGGALSRPERVGDQLARQLGGDGTAPPHSSGPASPSVSSQAGRSAPAEQCAPGVTSSPAAPDLPRLQRLFSRIDLRDKQALLMTAAQKETMFKIYLALKKHPAVAGLLAELVVHNQLSPRTAQLAVSLLGQVPGSSSRAALMRIIEQTDRQPGLQRAAIHSLGSYPSADPQAETYLRKLIRDPNLAAAAYKALGQLAHRLPDKRSARAGRLARLLLGAWQEAPTAARRRERLRAIGKAGLPQHLGLIEQLIADDSWLERATAVAATHRMPGKRVDRLLRRRLLEDPAVGVRQAAMTALAGRPAGIPTLLRSLEGQPAPLLSLARKMLIRQLRRNPTNRQLLVRHRATSPAARKLVDQVLRESRQVGQAPPG